MVQMGVKRIFLDAAFEGAKSAWMAPSLGFTEISKEEYEILALQFTFVSNPKVAARCIKVVPAHAALLKQLTETASKLPKDIFQVKKENRRVRLGKHVIQPNALAAPKRQKQMTTRMENSSAKLDNLRHSYGSK
ncbi:hypothetical protein ABBQ38_001399 [Trebouxia sp. C0009 RCD-2024]